MPQLLISMNINSGNIATFFFSSIVKSRLKESRTLNKVSILSSHENAASQVSKIVFQYYKVTYWGILEKMRSKLIPKIQSSYSVFQVSAPPRWKGTGWNKISSFASALFYLYLPFIPFLLFLMKRWHSFAFAEWLKQK